MFNNNPYRILGVLSNSGLKIIQKNLSKIKAYSKIGKQIKLPYDLDHLKLNSPERNDKSIIDAENKILSDSNRVKHGLFWFVNLNSFDEVALDKLDSGDIEKSELIWNKQIKGKPVSKSNFSSYNNLSTLFFLKSLDTSKNNQFLNNAESKKLISEAIKLKSELIFSEHLHSFSKLITGNENCVSKDDIIEFFNESILSILNKNFDGKEISKIIRNSSEELALSFNSSLIDEPLNLLNELISESNQKLNENNLDGVELGKELIKKSLNLLKTLKEILGENDIKFQSISDKLANQIMQSGILYFNKKGDHGDYLSSYKYALSISFKDSSKERANKCISHFNEQKELNTCCNCRKYPVDLSKPKFVEMYKITEQKWYSNSVRYNQISLKLFFCNHCNKKIKDSNDTTLYVSLFLTLVFVVYVFSSMGADGWLLVLIFGFMVFGVSSWLVGLFNSVEDTAIDKQYLVKKSKKEGYTFTKPGN